MESVFQKTRSVSVAKKVGMRLEREHTDEYGLCHIYAMSLAGWA